MGQEGERAKAKRSQALPADPHEAEPENAAAADGRADDTKRRPACDSVVEPTAAATDAIRA